MSHSDQQRLTEAWELLDARAPRVATRLRALQSTRDQQLVRYATGARMAGLEEVLAYLEAALAAYEKGPDLLVGAARLVRRAHADYVIAIDASLSGLLSVA